MSADRAETERPFLRARSRTIRHPNGHEVRTPLLVPSFSSKGFDVIDRKSGALKGRLVSEASKYLQFFGNRLTESFLVSAYDLHHQLLDGAEKMARSYRATVFASPALLFVDSGLYEYRLRSDAGEPLQEMRLPSDWTEAGYETFVDTLPAQASNVALVSWDRYLPYREQIDAAQAFFARHKPCMKVILLKPERQGKTYDIRKLTPVAERLAAFDVVGLTEKELGASILDRATTIALLRDLLDMEDVLAPLHVFGGLDPLYAPLYFAAGAEIFDGRTWLRYAFVDGIAIHRDSWPVLFGQLDKEPEQRTLTAQSNNLDELEKLGRLMKRYVHEKVWSVYRQSYGERTTQALEDAYLGLESELRT